MSVVGRYPSQWYFAEAIAAIEGALSVADRRLELHNLGQSTSRLAFFERMLPRNEVAELIVVSSSLNDREIVALQSASVPTVVVGGFVPGFPCVGIDEAAAARIATEHLIGLGHQEIGMISFDPDDLVGRETTLARRRGFETALAHAGLSVVPDWISNAEGSRMAGGVLAAERLLSRPRLPTALFAMSDELAIGALDVIRRAGLSVPEQMSIVGIDDHEMAPFVALTTVRQPVQLQAQEAVRLLLERSTTATKVELAVRLVVRGTTGPIRTRTLMSHSP